MPGPDTSSVGSVGNKDSARAIFPKGPSFTLENFSASLASYPFVEKEDDRLMSFDPKPFIRTFEHALSRLASLSEDLELHESELLNGVRRAEVQHTKTLDSLGSKLDQTIASFQSLDTSLHNSDDDVPGRSDMDAGGNAAVRIGEKLEEMDKQRRRALDAKFLIQCWLEVSERGELIALEDVRRQGGGEGKVRCAVISRQLMRISQRLDPESWSTVTGTGKGVVNGVNGAKSRSRKYNTRELIEKFSETLEKDLLKQFDEFYRRQNFDGMRECANVLYDFNGGASVVALFVNQHQFFIDRSQLITDELDADGEIWERLADPDAEPPAVEPSLQSLIDEVKIVVQDESAIIKRAFPYHELVLGKFLQRVFQQSIQQRLEMVLEKANKISSLAFLRSLQASRSYMSALVDDLKSHGLTEHPEPSSSQTTTTLDQQLDDLLVPYLLSSSYIEREKRSLAELYASLLFKFTIYHSRRKKLPTTFMATLAKSGSELLASAKDAYIDRLDSSDLSPAQKAMLVRVAGLKEAESTKNKNEIEVTDQDGVLSVPNAKRMLKWLAEGVGRGLELSGGSETPKEVGALLNLLLENMGAIYVETALDAAADFASNQENSKTEPDLSYLPNLRAAITIMHLMITFINTVLIPLAASNLTVRREMEKTTALAVNRMEDKTNLVMQRTIDVVVTWISKLLAGQKRTDFRPKEGGVDIATLQTPVSLPFSPLEIDDALFIPLSNVHVAELTNPSLQTCASTKAFLSKLHSLLLITLPQASSFASPGNPNPNNPNNNNNINNINNINSGSGQAQNPTLIALSTELAVSIRSVLLEHFKKFPVNATGALMVAKDMTAYTSALKAFPLSSEFLSGGGLDALAEVGNLFVVGAEALGDRLKAGGGVAAAGASAGGVGLDRAEIRAYVLKREDVGSVAVQRLLAGL
ncbi:MAG: Exocyst complex component 5 [Sclerophora amabilis]|nr:MAG: Exocyst complex component 5 [Sclerophora amabilis]